MKQIKNNINHYPFHVTGIIIFSLILIGFIYLFEGNLIGNVILDSNSTGFNGESRSANYEELVDNIFSNPNVTSIIDENFLWVPWFTTSSECNEQSLHQDSSCNIGTINFTQNCMVSDEFSQVGIITSLGSNQTNMDLFYNTLFEIKSSNGVLASWRSYRNGSTIVACGDGVNSNCDTASDADARIIISLFTASNNSLFTDEIQKKNYANLATLFAEDFVRYEIVNECHPSGTQHGDICHWLASGSSAKNAGLSSNNFGYTGYYSDAVIAMLQACAQTYNMTYCSIAKNLTLNYLQASQFNGNSFSVPPGRSFKWVNITDIPVAECTDTCNPIEWDDYDAPRALGICQAPYYASLMNMTLPSLDNYCNLWRLTHLSDPGVASYRYLPDGNIAHSPQSGYFAQGLQSLALFATDSYQETIDNALSHYDPDSKKWDNSNCQGVYATSIPIRSLGAGLGRDKVSFQTTFSPETPPFPEENDESEIQTSPEVGKSNSRSTSIEVNNQNSSTPTLINTTYNSIDVVNLTPEIWPTSESPLSGFVVKPITFSQRLKMQILPFFIISIFVVMIFALIFMLKHILVKKE